MQKQSWKDTDIFRCLKTKTCEESQRVIHLLERDEVMKAISKLLDHGGTTPKDFTLHDAGHSYRVSQRMWMLVPEGTKNSLSVYELGLLILSAYLHDIGMSPEYEKVETHRIFLMTDDKTGLNENEIKEFQKWIDNDSHCNNIDISKDCVTDEGIARYILSYYIRSKHNDWSGEWILKNLANIPLPYYPFWQDDLILICKSHHYGFDQLMRDEYNPKPVSDKNVHLRYLSMCLRVADVMENDPERTPDVILNHRSISAGSLIYWLKDKQFNLVRDGDKYSIYARPENAYIHKAILETAQWIEQELKLCDELKRLKPLNHLPISAGSYEWDIDSFLHKDILPKSEAYVYINGAFRPNTAKILELLGGPQLYGNIICAFRELIQNAFDAVKERIAYHILNEDLDPKKYLTLLGELFNIEISLEKNGEDLWLICKDKGAGMTKSIIEKYFLESGASKRHEIKDLERRCSAKGFNFTRTGHFGIGVLSYFMLADEMFVITKREQNTGYHDSESTAWQFKINGTHDFGEMSTCNKSASGTEIRLRLRKDIVDKITEWDDKFFDYCKDDILKSPCSLQYKSYRGKELFIETGWTNKDAYIKDMICSEIKIELLEDKSYHRLLKLSSSEMKEQKLKYKEEVEDTVEDMKSKLGFLVEEGFIDSIGAYRIHIPWFNLSRGACFVYLREKVTTEEHQIIHTGFYNCLRPIFDRFNVGLKGIKINAKNQDTSVINNFLGAYSSNLAYVELDVEGLENLSLAVSRLDLLFDHQLVYKIEESVEASIRSLVERHSEQFDNIYSLINYSDTRKNPTDLHWCFYDSVSGKTILREVKYPLVVQDDLNEKKDYFFEGKLLNIAQKLYYPNSTVNAWDDYIISCPVLCNSQSKFEKSPVWTDFYRVFRELPTGYGFTDKIALFAYLPKEWGEVFIYNGMNEISENADFYVNENSILSQFCNEIVIDFEYDMIFDQTVIQSKTSCATFLINFFIKFKHDEWINLCGEEPKLMHQLFEMLAVSDFYILEDNSLIRIYSGGALVITDKNIIEKIMPVSALANGHLIKESVN
jgi:hypothetical protein